jgi:hypothetical protein
MTVQPTPAPQAPWWFRWLGARLSESSTWAAISSFLGYLSVQATFSGWPGWTKWVGGAATVASAVAGFIIKEKGST